MSVFLKVEHHTTYRYHKPVEFSPHRVMFRPRAAHDIRVVSSNLEVSPLSRQYWVQDVFSNSVAVVEPRVPADRLEFRASFVIEHLGTKNLELPLDASAESYPFKYADEDRLDLANFLPPQYSEDQPIVREWVSQFLPKRGTIHTRDVLTNINSAIRGDFTYQSRDAMGTQRPAETLKLRSGTCRDFALFDDGGRTRDGHGRAIRLRVPIRQESRYGGGTGGAQ
jgi:transglutaminase-like putative cysteine protease